MPPRRQVAGIGFEEYDANRRPARSGLPGTSGLFLFFSALSGRSNSAGSIMGRSGPIVLQQTGQRAVRENEPASLACRAVVGFALGISDASNRASSVGAGFPETAMGGESFRKDRNFARSRKATALLVRSNARSADSMSPAWPGLVDRRARRSMVNLVVSVTGDTRAACGLSSEPAVPIPENRCSAIHGAPTMIDHV